jgi:hypothetical protein
MRRVSFFALFDCGAETNVVETASIEPIPANQTT